MLNEEQKRLPITLWKELVKHKTISITHMEEYSQAILNVCNNTNITVYDRISYIIVLNMFKYRIDVA